MYLIGYDIGSSSIKAALVDAQTGKSVATAQSPATEMTMIAKEIGWAEQHPEVWWEHVCIATQQLFEKYAVHASTIKGIGIAYQMHGLVVVDEKQKVLRPSIIWCDSRAVEIGRQAFEEIGQERCLREMLNSPGNFTAAKLKWIKDNEPEIYARIDKIMLPGDYIAMRMTGDIVTTTSGLSEGVFYDFTKNKTSKTVLDYFDFSEKLIPKIKPTFSVQGKLSAQAARETGLQVGTPVTYRAGDQPNNALSLNVLEPGEIAATGGTSGVVYGVVDQPAYDNQSRVNGFAHVNHSATQPRIGVLLCINGSGILYKWLRENMTTDGISYQEMNEMAEAVPPGSAGLSILPFGNGAERMLDNQNPGATIYNLQFNTHTKAYFYRAALEGIAFSFIYGIRIMESMGLNVRVIRVGNDNLFRSHILAQTVVDLQSCAVEVINTNGAIGAAKAAGVGVGIYHSANEAMQNSETIKLYQPKANPSLRQAYDKWCQYLQHRVQSK